MKIKDGSNVREWGNRIKRKEVMVEEGVKSNKRSKKE